MAHEATSTIPERSVEEAADPRCGADWRRPGRYWTCDRALGHRGRHRLVEVAVHLATGRREVSAWERRQLVIASRANGHRHVG